MKKLPLVFLTLTLTLGLAACGGGSTPTDTTGGTVVTPGPGPAAIATLTVTVTGVASAPIKVTEASGTVKFDGAVSGSKAFPDLPHGKYTVTAGAVTNFTAPGVQTADLTSGDGALTLTYMALPGTLLDANTVSGTIPDWKLGKASAMVAHIFTLTSNGQYSRSTGLVSPAGTVATDGTLNIALPPSLDASYLSAFFPTNSSCTFIGTATDPTFQSDWYANKLIQVGDSPLGRVQEYVSGSPADSRHIVERVYVPADVTIKGTYNCPAGTDFAASTETYDLTLNKGWNAVEFFKNSDTDYQYRMLTAGTRVELQYVSFTPGIQFTLGDTSGLTLKRGDKVTRTARIVQVGGYSGTVSLATNVPGVTVDPATVTLNSVTSQALNALAIQAQTNPSALQRLEQAQSIGASSLATTLTFTASADAMQHDGSTTDQVVAKDASGTTLGGVNVPITVNVPSATGLLSSITLDRGLTVTSTVSLYSNSGYTGPVTISLENLPDGVTAQSVQTNLSSGYVTASLSLTASATAAGGTKSSQLVVNAGGALTRTPVDITVRTPSVAITALPVTVFAGERTELQITLTPVAGFSGSVNLTLNDLPVGVSQVSSVSVNVDGTVALSIPIQAAAGSITAQMQSSVIVTSGNTSFKQAVQVQVYPQRFILPTTTYTNGSAIDRDGNLWLSGRTSGTYGKKQYYKVNSTGSIMAYDDTSYGCGDLRTGGDGNVWDSGPPYLQIDVTTGATTSFSDPRGFSGCGGAPNIDASGRAWDNYFGLYRLDLVNHKADVINDISLLAIDGNMIWASGTGGLVKVNGDTLETQNYKVPGITNYSGMVPRGNLLWFPNSGLNSSQLGVFNLSTGITNFYDVPGVGGSGAGDRTLLGADVQGRFWFQYRDYFSNITVWALFDPAIKANVKVMPGIRSEGSDSRVRVLPNGDLWVQVGNSLIYIRL